tara:strand:+ start:3428 stop:3529 length:102 start_codon:yes stop_codon:yes gene_type:complete
MGGAALLRFEKAVKSEIQIWENVLRMMDNAAKI